MIICNGTYIIFDGESKVSTGKQQKQGGGVLGGETHFPGGSSFSLGGAAFQRDRAGECNKGCLLTGWKSKVSSKSLR